MRKIYKTPTGKNIIGVLQRLWGVAYATGPDDDGDPDYTGSTDIDWDAQEDVLAENPAKHGEDERVWICEDGIEWFESQLVVEEVDE